MPVSKKLPKMKSKKEGKPVGETKSYKPSGHAVSNTDAKAMKKTTPGKKVMEGRKGTLHYPKKKGKTGMKLDFGKNRKKG